MFFVHFDLWRLRLKGKLKQRGRATSCLSKRFAKKLTMINSIKVTHLTNAKRMCKCDVATRL